MVGGMPGDVSRIIGVIPARYQSSRFPGKPLIDICGIPMLKRTFLQAAKSTYLDHLIVATDDKRIFNYCLNENIPCEYTSSNCLTGTDRLAEIASKKEYSKYSLYINIQGDEPVIDPQAIDQLSVEYQNHKNTYSVYNLYKVITDYELINSKTIIKVIVNENDELMYMSRLPVPFSNTDLKPKYKQQIPVYAFTVDALKVFSTGQKTLNEQYEDIELLRFVDKGYKIKMKETSVTSIAVDIPEDVKKIEDLLNNNAV